MRNMDTHKLIEMNHLKRKEGGWDCKYCSSNFNTRKLLYEHISNVHKDKTRSTRKNISWKCKYCSEVFANRRALFEHFKVCDIKQSVPKDSLGRTAHPESGKKTAETKRILGIKSKPHKQSDETKKKISESQKKAFREGRNKPWVNPSINRSFAEEYFYNIFKGCENNYYCNGYVLDFAWVEKKCYVEVDGEQHYTEDGLKHDTERTKFLSEKGWKLIKRIRWSAFKKLTLVEKELEVEKIISEIAAIGETE